MAKTASDLAEKIGALTEDLMGAAKMEVRKDIAHELGQMIKSSDPESIKGYLRGTPNYLPGTDADTFAITDDFVKGIRFVISALKDSDFDF